jgi:hypothetical protein
MLQGFAQMFSDPAASEVYSLKRQSYGALYLMLCGSFLYAGQWRRSLAYAVKSVCTWPPTVGYLMAMPLRRMKRRLFGNAGSTEPAIESR